MTDPANLQKIATKVATARRITIKLAPLFRIRSRRRLLLIDQAIALDTALRMLSDEITKAFEEIQMMDEVERHLRTKWKDT